MPSVAKNSEKNKYDGTQQSLGTHFLGHTGMIAGLYGVVFHDEDASGVQKSVALQNNTKHVQKMSNMCRKSGFFCRESKNEMSGII